MRTSERTKAQRLLDGDATLVVADRDGRIAMRRTLAYRAYLQAAISGLAAKHGGWGTWERLVGAADEIACAAMDSEHDYCEQQLASFERDK